MTLFWIFAGLLSIIVIVMMGWPLLSKQSSKLEEPLDEADYDTAVYKSQLEEVKRDLARGELTEEEAESARVEIAKRLLLSDAKRNEVAQKDVVEVKSSAKNIFIALSIGAVVTVASVGTYLTLGNPTMPNFPYAEREAEREAARQASQTQPELENVLAEMKRRAEADPDNMDGWLGLAAAQMQSGKYAEAVFALAEAIRIDRLAPGVLASYAEAQVLASNGVVGDEVKFIFDEVLSVYPDDPRAAFYNAQYEYQKGDPEKAVQMLLDLLKGASPDAGWYAPIRQELVQMSINVGVDIRDQLAELPDAKMAQGFAGPDAETMADAAEMSAEDRSDMIAGMVDSLAARLEENPDVAEDWQKLARAATVLGQEGRVTLAYDNLIRLNGETPSLLLEKANALMQVSKGHPTPMILDTMGRVLKLDPNNVEALWFSAMAALAIGNKEKAEVLFDKVLASLGAGDPEYASVKAEIARLLQ